MELYCTSDCGDPRSRNPVSHFSEWQSFQRMAGPVVNRYVVEAACKPVLAAGFFLVELLYNLGSVRTPFDGVCFGTLYPG